MPSLMNGLSSAGAGLSGFAANYAAEQQKADAAAALQQSGGVIQGGLIAQRAALDAELARQADAMVTTRESAARVQSGQIAATAAEKLAGTQSAARQQEADLANRALTPEQKLLIGLGVPMAGTSPASAAAPSNYVDTGTWDGSASPAAANPASAPAESNPASSAMNNPKVRSLLGFPQEGSAAAIDMAIAQGVRTDPKFSDASEAAIAAETKKRIANASASLSSDALDTIADRTIAGDTSALTGLGYGEGGAANRAAAQERITQKLQALGMTGADLAAKIASYSGEKAGARTAGTREANVGMAVTEAQLFMPLALAASKAVPRTDFPTLNSIMLAAEKGTGGENVVRLAVATNSLVNAYSRAITPSGIPTEGNQARARELLDKAWADGQYAAAIDQLGKEMAAAKQSPVQQQAEQAARIGGHPSPNAAGQANGQTDAAPAATVPTPSLAAKPAAAPKPPAVGEVQQGYTFQGGNPADPASWKAVK